MESVMNKYLDPMYWVNELNQINKEYIRNRDKAESLEMKLLKLERQVNKLEVEKAALEDELQEAEETISMLNIEVENLKEEIETLQDLEPIPAYTDFIEFDF